MSYLEILYEDNDHDKVFHFLKTEFGESTANVEVTEHVPNEFVRIEWSDSIDPFSLASKMTESVPSVVIETESNNDLESASRFFNGAQLW